VNNNDVNWARGIVTMMRMIDYIGIVSKLFTVYGAQENTGVGIGGGK
jgi:hypothetical protein